MSDIGDAGRALRRIDRKCEALRALAEEVGELERRQRDVTTLDLHVRTLSGGSYWYSNDDTCGVVDGSEGERNWHRHGYDEHDARHGAAEYVRSLSRAPTELPPSPEHGDESKP